MNKLLHFSTTQMIVTSIMAIFMGIILLTYPGLTLMMMIGAFWSIQIVLTLFIVINIASEIVRDAETGLSWAMAFPIALGLLAIALVWYFEIGFIHIVVALFFLLSGIFDIFCSLSARHGKFFIFLLGVINFMVGIIVLKYPLALSVLIAWYILFWGISRLLLALEVRGLMKQG